jgi:hypothetical protein
VVAAGCHWRASARHLPRRDLLKENACVDIATADQWALLNTLDAVERLDDIFATYLLPSLLGIKFISFADGLQTQFGRHAASSALLNANQLATADPAVPAVSLRFVDSLLHKGCSNLHAAVRALVTALAFCKLDGTGKDFKRAWVLLTFTMLQLQFLVRVSAAATSFWPTPEEPGVKLGGPARPTAEQIDVFASNDNRIEALFARPDDDRFAAKCPWTKRRRSRCGRTPGRRRSSRALSRKRQATGR